jgi:mannose-1-phosphate guanylyltransferase
MYAVILAGGGGTRLWPLSRGQTPKPFLPILEGGRCLLEATVSRLVPLIEATSHRADARYARSSRCRAAVPGAIGDPGTPPQPWRSPPMPSSPGRGHGQLHADEAIADEAGFGRPRGGRAGERSDIVTVGIRPTGPSPAG